MWYNRAGTKRRESKENRDGTDGNGKAAVREGGMQCGGRAGRLGEERLGAAGRDDYSGAGEKNGAAHGAGVNGKRKRERRRKNGRRGRVSGGAADGIDAESCGSCLRKV